MLAGAHILIVEDDFFTALELADEVEAAGGTVVGPYASVSVTLRALRTERVDAAILDANLADRDVTPVAAVLAARHLPFVIHSGVAVPPALALLQPELSVVMKPASPFRVMAALAEQLH